jgi:transposase
MISGSHYKYVGKVPEHLITAATLSAHSLWLGGLNTLEISELLRVSEAEIYNLLGRYKELDRLLKKRAGNV